MLFFPSFIKTRGWFWGSFSWSGTLLQARLPKPRVNPWVSHLWAFGARSTPRPPSTGGLLMPREAGAIGESTSASAIRKSRPWCSSGMLFRFLVCRFLDLPLLFIKKCPRVIHGAVGPCYSENSGEIHEIQGNPWPNTV